MENMISKWRTVCEVLREINDLHQGDTRHDRAVRKKLVEAEAMAKRMSRKLLEYNEEVYKDWWERNPNYKAKLLRRMNKSYLVGDKDNGTNKKNQTEKDQKDYPPEQPRAQAKKESC